MHSPSRLEHICGALGRKFGAPGETAAEQLRAWLNGDIPYSHREIIERHLDERCLALVFDAFHQMLPFGTGGRRGPVGYGPNRVNPATVAMTVQGHCDYLRAHNPVGASLAVVVANDVRIFVDFAGVYSFLPDDHPLLGLSSRTLAQLACEIYAANGIVAHLQSIDCHQGLMSTPEMSFQIRRLGAVGGVQFSASHNPPDDNGIKIYNQFGSQPIAPEDERLATFMDSVKEVRTLTIDIGVERGLIRWIGEAGHSAYIDTYIREYQSRRVPDPSVPIVFAPLNGCGRSSVGDLLERLGYRVLTPPSDVPDGTFPSVPLKAPNPEVSQATGPAKDFADKERCGIVLSSDPDVDRIGLDVKLEDGSWHHFDGNQIAAILCYFLMLDTRGPQRRGLVIETFVTTRILGEIARKANSALIDDLPVGMKYIANVLNELEETGRYGDIVCALDHFAFAAEESHGVILTPSIREKDAAPAAMYLACLYQLMREEGQTLLQYYEHVLDQLGAFETVNRSIVLRGSAGEQSRDAMMSALRATPLAEFAGEPVRKVVDFLDVQRFGPFKGHTDQQSRNAVQIFTDAFVVAVRPSGTEPKLKFYCHLLPSQQAGRKSLRELKRVADEIACAAYNDLLHAIGMKLGQVGLLLPDIVSLDEKIRFERLTIPALQERLTDGTVRSLDDHLEWLRQQTATMAPGADSLPALKSALADQCSLWLNELRERPAPLLELAAWVADR